jgi:hypothetical protein
MVRAVLKARGFDYENRLQCSSSSVSSTGSLRQKAAQVPNPNQPINELIHRALNKNRNSAD